MVDLFSQYIFIEEDKKWFLILILITVRYKNVWWWIYRKEKRIRKEIEQLSDETFNTLKKALDKREFETKVSDEIARKALIEARREESIKLAKTRAKLESEAREKAIRRRLNPPKPKPRATTNPFAGPDIIGTAILGARPSKPVQTPVLKSKKKRKGKKRKKSRSRPPARTMSFQPPRYDPLGI